MDAPESARSVELRTLAQAMVDELPAYVEEAVLTGSVSRGVADELSDIEVLLVTREELALPECYELAAGCGLTGLGTWGPQGGSTRRVSGRRDGVPIELIWWSERTAEAAVDTIFAGRPGSTADALHHGVPLRTSGRLADWQARLRVYPDELAGAEIEDACLTWGGFAAAGLLTVARPGERLALLERMVDDAGRVVRVVYAVNRVWPPTLKRLADRVRALSVVPPRLAERIEEALTEADAARALLVLTELQLDAVASAPDGPNVERAREWLTEARQLLTGWLALPR